MVLRRFHPAVAEWFASRFSAPTETQAQAWEAVASGQHVLVAAPTGSGKTLAAFLSAIDELARECSGLGLPDETRVLYISPLKALSNDINRNLEEPLSEINVRLFETGSSQFVIRSMVRTGDTGVSERNAMAKRPPHILVSTPESVYILLTSESGRRMLKTVRTVIVDEIHALVGNKRGAHLALSLERLEHLTEGHLIRVGLSATQNPIVAVGQFLTGGRECCIIDGGHQRRLDLAIELPDLPLEAVLSAEAARAIHDRMAALAVEHKSTLVFVNTRRQAERLARALSDRLGTELVTSHHGSLSREQRLSAEYRLKCGQLKVLVATASMELGIDVGDVDLVCQLGTTGSISTFLQRIGRSGHFAGGLPKGRLFPTSRDDLIECIALLDAVRRGELDRLCIPEHPFDVLAQQLVALLANEDFSEGDLFRLVRKAYPYRNLSREHFDDVVKMLAEGYASRFGQRGACVYRDGINSRLRARKGARLTALTCGGAIPDNADYRVILEPSGELIGTVDEHFAIESMAGDVFQLGNASWRVRKLEGGTLRVEDAQHQPPSIPFWFGEAPGRSHELSVAVGRLSAELDALLPVAVVADPSSLERALEPAMGFLVHEVGVSTAAAVQAVNYLYAAKMSLGVLPTLDILIFERFFDQSGGMQFIIHSPYGSRVNRGWGLALRKRFCRSFNFELQAAATENALILSLGTSQSFELEDVCHYLSVGTVRNLLIQAVLAAPMFNVRWRWNAVCSLALKRFQGGRKTPPYLLRMQAEDLVGAVFPDQLACLENIVGDRDIPDHPLVSQSLQDCLTEAMDIERLEALIHGIEVGSIRVVCRDLLEPSPLAAEIVNSRVYTFLDGAPLEERRTRAVVSRRWLDPLELGEMGGLDARAIDKVRAEVWPKAGDADELHDALNTMGFLDAGEAEPGWQELMRHLTRQNRATILEFGNGRVLWLAVERLPQFMAVYPELKMPVVSGVKVRIADFNLFLSLPEPYKGQIWSPEDALRELLRGRLSAAGPVTVLELARMLELPPGTVEQALLALQVEGVLFRGRFEQKLESGEEGLDGQWCERRLLARMHRYTIARLRQEIEPVETSDFMRFLFEWQRVHPDNRMQGREALEAVLAQLEGFEAAAAGWESDILPARLADYDTDWLDSLCLSGKVVWSRLSSAKAGQSMVKASPIAFLNRRNVAYWRQFVNSGDRDDLSPRALFVAEILAQKGALFFDELSDLAGFIPTHLEMVLGELVARGFVASDSFMGLRALLIPEQRKLRYRRLAATIQEAGRWMLVRPLTASDGKSRPLDADMQKALEHVALVLLRRYGVVFRALMGRESGLPPWVDLLRVYRAMEARGDIRGGRFVAGQSGEQFALPEALSALRAVKNRSEDERSVIVSAVDALNLVGYIMPGNRVPALPGNRVLFRSGLPLAVSSGRDVSFLKALDIETEREVRELLLRKVLPVGSRSYLRV